jgi:hypothetical protein
MKDIEARKLRFMILVRISRKTVIRQSLTGGSFDFRWIAFPDADQAAFSVSRNRTAEFYMTDRLATRVNGRTEVRSI